VHAFYEAQGRTYSMDKFDHAMAVWDELNPGILKNMNEKNLKEILLEAVAFKEWLSKGIHDSREKDYTNSFRKMVYDNKEEMNEVVGKFEDNSFIRIQKQELAEFKARVNKILKQLAK
jgi:hypothetical protein